MEKKVMDNLNNNPNLSDDNRIMIYQGLCDIKSFIEGCYEVNINFDNILNILATVKLVDVEDADSYFSYSSSDNQITRKKTDDEDMIFDFCSSLFRLLSQRYDSDANKYRSGLLIEDENGIHNNLLNDEVISRLTTMYTGLEDKKRIDTDTRDKEDGTCIRDVIVNDMSEVVGFQNLLAHFFDARGIEFYETLAEKISEEKAKDFISIADSSMNHSSADPENKIAISKRRKYDAYIALMKEKSLEVIPSL